MALKSLESSYIYGHLNPSGNLTKAIVALMGKDSETITKEQILIAYSIIQKKSIYAKRMQVLENFDNGLIQLKWLPENYKFPSCLPFILIRGPKGVVAMIPLNLIGKKDKNSDGTGSISVDPVKLYTYMESAYFAREIIQNQDKVSMNTYFIRNGSDIYSQIFTRVLNKKYSLNVHRELYQTVVFLSSLFYMVNILSMKINDITTNYALTNCPNANVPHLIELVGKLSPSAFDNISNFMQMLTNPNLDLQLNGLTVRGYLEAFITTYDASALMLLESFPYFVYNIISVMYGAYLNNQYVLDDILTKENQNKFYSGLLSLSGRGV